jgi:hypothetical protein
MRDMMPPNSGPPGPFDATSAARVRAQELVAGWMAGTSSVRPPADVLRVEQLGPINEAPVCFCAGTFCWVGDTGAGVRR